MISSVLLLFGAALAYGLYSIVSGLRRNIAAAKRTGLPYYVIPLDIYDMPGRFLNSIWVPIFKKLPRKYWEDIEPVLQRDWHYQQNHKAFAGIGEAFILVSPNGMILLTDNAEAIHQITSKREAFPKPTGSYTILSQYGDNVLTTEGAVWRMHRKVTSASFNEKNAALVFRESIHQARGLISQWLGPDGQGNKTIKSVEHDTMSLMLNIIGYVGFGLRLLWPGQTLPPGTDPKLAKYATLDAPEGHTMSFTDSLASTLRHLLILLILPKWLLNILPYKRAKMAVESESNYLKYMYEFLHDKIEDVRTGNAEEGMDIMGQLVRTSYGDKPTNGSTTATGTKKEATPPALSDAEIIGNAFIMIVAGHETTANVIHFSLLELAINPAAQRKLHKDIDAILGDKEPDTWDYKMTDPLQGSMVGACVNETLRLMPPVCSIPKQVSPGQDQVITINGEKHLLPQKMQIDLTIVAAQRNPRYWPTRPSRVTGAAHDVDDFVPERWFQTSGGDKDNGAVVEGADTEDFGGFAGPDTSAQLYRPPRGAFIPFSDGARSCLGRRIAQVELLASLSTIFQRYSIELAVDEWASDEEVARMGRAERAAVYKKAQDKARATIRCASTRLTLKLHRGQYVPVRLVKRGEERFVDWVDADA
ncbi:hypothetical protein DL766_006226 [Monosporascus sp. MC13-8B]|uniref:Cytochrome P450 n=1 Tax=Monosporascus cannonballus TaxID=155416 RepID=A0ABY0HDB9_9PEZI|nr:hypothetical protein DL763_010336 [Monosporascus cannonballus]RYO89019.1 hypothetical protein DL762_003449 [Monosporascus cannonballus]RYP27782.1 hypothetical protein DL766_006226 [Monosporascus sp. MC13-8B]